MDEVVITSMARTGVGKFGGSLKDVPAVTLGSLVAKEAVRRAGLEPSQIERLVFGENIQMNRGGNPARRIHLEAGFPFTIDDYTINMNCASGMRAIVAAAQDILLGDIDVAVAGGMENMSQTPYVLENARFGYRLGNGVLYDFLADHILGDAGPMAENVASKYHVTREDQDTWAYESQQRAAKAHAQNYFADQILPVEVAQGKEKIVFATDEHMRPDSSLEKLAKLRPAFKKEGGTVTAGNASGINDAGAAVTVMSAKKAQELGKKPLAIIRGWSSAGVDPDYFGMGPVPATQKLFKRLGVSAADIAVVELNEAFASSTVAAVRELGLDPARVNPNGGAIALGHPVGATGVILIMKVISELIRTKSKLGLATMCIGSGQGMSVLIERV